MRNRERRQRLRSQCFRGRKLEIEHCGQSLDAKVVDSSDHGLGVELSAPLQTGSLVSFVGVGLRGCAQVVHCRSGDDGMFRVGLELEAVSFRQLDVSRRALPSETLDVPDQRGSQAKTLEPRMPQLARGSTHEETGSDGAGKSNSPEEGAVFSEMAQALSHAVEVALLDLELHRANEIKAIKRELRDSRPNKILQGWSQAQRQIAELKATVSEQNAGLATAQETLSPLRAEKIQTTQRRQAGRVDSILERLTRQEAELPKLKESVEDLSEKLNAVIRRLDALSKASGGGDAAEAVKEQEDQTEGLTPDQTEASPKPVREVAADPPAASNGSVSSESAVEIEEERREVEPPAAAPPRQGWVSSRVLKLAVGGVAVGLAIGAAHWISSEGSSQQDSKAASSTVAREAAVAVPMRGIVVDKGTGRPITHATLYTGGVELTTNARGEFELPSDATRGALGVKAAGYKQQTLERLENPFTVRLEPIQVKAIYVSQRRMAQEAGYGAIRKLLDETPLNALVVAVKSPRGRLILPVENPVAEQVGAYQPVWQDSLAEEVRSLKERGVYTIAHIAVFRDDLLARGKPELALKSLKTGQPVQDVSGLGWTNPALKPVRNYNFAVAKAAAEAGFDEIQFDFIRYPVSPSSAEGVDAAERQRRLQAVTEFLRAASRTLALYNVYVSATIFGSLCEMEQVTLVGQKLEEFAAAVDYVCPMLYPSSFGSSASFPDLLQHSYQLVEQNLDTAAGRLGGQTYKLRPWLQNFAPPGSSARGIGAETIGLQIRAAVDSRSSGWMLWDHTSRYRKTREALSVTILPARQLAAAGH